MKNITMVMAVLGIVMAMALPSVAGQWSPPEIEIDVPVDYKIHIDQGLNVGSGAVDFLYVEGYEPFAVMVVNAGSPVDYVNLSYSSMRKELVIEATDAKATNTVIILVNKAFVDEFIGTQENTNFTVSDSVNYEGLDNKFNDLDGSNETIDGGYYVFMITGFSTQTITIASTSFFTPMNTAIIIGLVVLIAIIVFRMKKKDYKRV